ncbi:hypothetical protein [Litorihabitans aurantiacus]|nr:hypothetical protein [Litorihabitans aurantiacus]
MPVRLETDRKFGLSTEKTATITMRLANASSCCSLPRANAASADVRGPVGAGAVVAPGAVLMRR